MSLRMTDIYRRYTGPLRRRPWLAWWPITRTELSIRVFRWRYLPLYLVAFMPFFFREALLYARFVVAPVRVDMMSNLSTGRMGRLLQWDHLAFYSDYLEDRFLWIFLLLVASVMGVPMVARDLRTRAWEIYFSRAIGRLDYFVGKLVAVFVVLFVLTWGGAVGLYLTTSLLGPDPDFFGNNIAWLIPLTLYAALLSGVLALAALAFGTFSENGLILSGAWLGIFFVAFCIGRVLRLVRANGEFDWVDPKYLFLAASSLLHDHPLPSNFWPWIGPILLAGLAVVSVAGLGLFLRRREEGIG